MTFRLPVSLQQRDDHRCVRALNTYFHGIGADGQASAPYTGRHFDTWGSRVPDAFTTDDVVAVSFLSVTVPSAVVPELVVDPTGRFRTLLEQSDCDDRDLVEVDVAEIDREWGPWKLWSQVSSLHGLGPTTTSKLLARKRPKLLPIWDTVLGSVVGPSNGFWVGLASSLQADNRNLHSYLLRIRDAANLDDTLSALRVFDVIGWMEGNGRS